MTAQNLSLDVFGREQQILPEAVLKKILFEFNNTDGDYPADKCIHQLFEEQVELTPNAISVVFEQQQLTYEALNQKANQLAHYLRMLGVKPEVLVGLCMERSLEMVIGMLGILKAGGVYVPLDPSYPNSRLTFILEDTQIPVLLTQHKLIKQLPEVQVISLDKEWDKISQADFENPLSEVKPDNLAYVIYTSGSTGKPKGVLIEHRGMCNLAFAHIKLFNVKPNSRILQFASISFDASVWEMIMGLCSGAQLCLASKEALLPGCNLLHLLRTQAITHVLLPPSALAVMPQEDIPTLQYLIVGGEACSAELAARWKTNRHFFNAYGPTESTVCATVAQITGDEHKLSIGSPLPNTQIYILDPALAPVPIGVAGELHIGGVGLARGYLNRPELTIEKFIPNPFSESSNARLYKTGDLARWLPDGNIEFLGRIDHQVKVRGFRIELGEIEAVLEQHRAIQQAVVIAREDKLGDKSLVAYVVPNLMTGDEVEEEIVPSLRGFLQRKLPEYMLPTAFGVLEKLPLTPNDKVDRRALASLPVDSYLLSEKTYIAPRTPQEEMLARLWAEVLDLKRVGIHDNFFELGGNSLKIIVLLNRLQKDLGKTCQMVDLFNAPTIAEFTASLKEKFSSSLEIIQKIATSPNADTNYFPPSFLQERFWTYRNLGSFYNFLNYFCLIGPLDEAVLQQSFNEIIHRHEILRTTLQEVNGSLVQVVAPSGTVNMSVVELPHLPEHDQPKEVEKFINEQIQHSVNLEKDPWLRVTLLRLGAELHILLIGMHHLVTDERSIEILFQELSLLYEAFSSGKPSPLPPLPLQYADYALRQRQSLTQEVLQAKLNYWQQWLSKEPPPLELPTDRPLPTLQTFRADTFEDHLSAELTHSLKIFSQQRQVTLFTTILTAFATLLYRASGCEDIVVGVPASDRNHWQLESLIGDFGKMLALRINLEGNPSFCELLTRVRQETLSAIANQDVPFEQLVKTQRTLKRNKPFFKVYLDFLFKEPAEQLNLAELTVTSLPIKQLMARLDLGLLIWEKNTASGTSLMVWWRYKKDLFDAKTIEQISENFQSVLEAIVADPEQSMGCRGTRAFEEKFY